MDRPTAAGPGSPPEGPVRTVLRPDEVPTGTCDACGAETRAWNLIEDGEARFCRPCSQAREALARRRRTTLLAWVGGVSVIALVLAAAFIGSALRHRATPEYSLDQLHVAFAEKDLNRMSRYWDMEATYQSIHDGCRAVGDEYAAGAAFLYQPVQVALSNAQVTRTQDGYAEATGTGVGFEGDGIGVQTVVFELERREDEDGVYWRVTRVVNAVDLAADVYDE
ncbi:MAG: hypothetical protein QMC79_04500 [Anaerosomatales bacterium]|nr:hypothetical protein [Anaerosomatales bacterium]